jgi:hypothetical protein
LARMNRRMAMADVLTGVMLSTAPVGAQSGVTGQLAELVALKEKVGNADTRVRVDALHRVWSVALSSGDSEVKVTAIGLLTEPVGSSSDHIRMPAVYAMADIANSTDHPRVKSAHWVRWPNPCRPARCRFELSRSTP